MAIENTFLTCAGLSFYVEYEKTDNDEGEVWVELLRVNLETDPHCLLEVLTDHVIQSLEEQITYL